MRFCEDTGNLCISSQEEDYQIKYAVFVSPFLIIKYSEVTVQFFQEIVKYAVVFYIKTELCFYNVNRKMLSLMTYNELNEYLRGHCITREIENHIYSS